MRFPVITLAAALLAGCGSISDLNPFGSSEKRLSGERETVFSTNSPLVESSGRAASIGPARSVSAWPQPGGNERNDPGHRAFEGSGGSRAWRTSVNHSGPSVTRGTLRVAARPVAAGERIVIYSPDGAVTALSASSGQRVWRTSLRPEGERDPASGGGVTVAGGQVFVATGYSEMAALDAGSGEVVWRRDIDTPARGAPTAGAGHVFVVSQKNELFAVDQSDGTLAFDYAGIPEQAGLLAASSPAVADGKVVVPYSSGEIMAFSVESGEPVWQSFVTRSMRTLAISGMTDVSGSPVIADGAVYATGVAGRTLSVALSDGSERWRRDIGSAHTPVVSGNAVFLIDLADRMVALDRNSGETLWMIKLPTEGKRVFAGPVLAGGALYGVSNKGRMVRVNPADGAILSDVSVAGAAYMAPILAYGRLIIVSDTGEITALR